MLKLVKHLLLISLLLILFSQHLLAIEREDRAMLIGHLSKISMTDGKQINFVDFPYGDSKCNKLDLLPNTDKRVKRIRQGIVKLLFFDDETKIIKKNKSEFTIKAKDKLKTGNGFFLKKNFPMLNTVGTIAKKNMEEIDGKLYVKNFVVRWFDGKKEANIIFMGARVYERGPHKMHIMIDLEDTIGKTRGNPKNLLIEYVKPLSFVAKRRPYQGETIFTAGYPGKFDGKPNKEFRAINGMVGLVCLIPQTMGINELLETLGAKDVDSIELKKLLDYLFTKDLHTLYVPHLMQYSGLGKIKEPSTPKILAFLKEQKIPEIYVVKRIIPGIYMQNTKKAIDHYYKNSQNEGYFEVLRVEQYEDMAKYQFGMFAESIETDVDGISNQIPSLMDAVSGMLGAPVFNSRGEVFAFHRWSVTVNHAQVNDGKIKNMHYNYSFSIDLTEVKDFKIPKKEEVKEILPPQESK